MQVSIFGFSNLLSLSVSYNRPTVVNALFVLNMTSFNVNLPSSGSVSITVVGSSFSTSDASISVKLRGSAGQSTVWKSDSSAVSKISAGAMNSQVWQVSVGIQCATVASFVSFDIPEVLSTNETEVPRSGSVSISLSGSGLGLFAASQRAAVASSCESSSWRSSSSIICKLAVGPTPNFVSPLQRT